MFDKAEGVKVTLIAFVNHLKQSDETLLGATLCHGVLIVKITRGGPGEFIAITMCECFLCTAYSVDSSSCTYVYIGRSPLSKPYLPTVIGQYSYQYRWPV